MMLVESPEVSSFYCLKRLVIYLASSFQILLYILLFIIQFRFSEAVYFTPHHFPNNGSL